MTTTIKKLWWRGNSAWLIGVMVALLTVASVTAIAGTQRWQVNHQQMQRGYQINAANYRKSPQSFKINGQPAKSERAYYDYNDQYFSRHEFTATNGVTRTDRYQMNNYFYGIALLAGLLLSFWPRRTHYHEFLLGLGLKRSRLWWQQLQTVALMAGTMMISQVVHYAWIGLVIPNRYLQTFALGDRVGSGIAVTILSVVMLALGWLIGNVTDHFWLAAVIGGLTWRWLNGLLTNTVYQLPRTGEPVMPNIWLYAHYNVASLLGLVVLAGLLSLSYATFRRWTAEPVRLKTQPWLPLICLSLLMGIGVGALFGDVVLISFFNTYGPVIEFSGMAVVLIIWLGWLVWYRGNKGGRRNA